MGKSRLQLKSSSTWWVLAAIVLLGIALRLYLLASSRLIIEADEALVGLQAFGILRGERPIFYPGQTYGGSLESYLVAGVFLLFGASPLTLKVVPFLFSVLFIVVTYLLATEIYQPRVGLLSALLVALCPLLLTAFSQKTWGGYSETPVLGSLALLLLVRLLYGRREGKGAWRAALALGLVSGLGFWINPQYFYYALPVLLCLLLAVRRVGVGGIAAFGAGGIVGGLPLLAASLSRSASSTSSLSAAGVVPAGDLWPSVTAAARYFVSDALPTLWGLRPIKGEMVPTLAFVVIPIYLSAVLASLWWAGRDLKARRDNPASVLMVTLILAPPVLMLAALTNGNWTAIIPDSGILARYLLSFYSVVPILVAAFIWRVKESTGSKAVAGVLIALLLAVNLWSNLSVDPVDAMRCVFENVPLPASNRDLIAFLEREGIRSAYTDHWIGYRLMFETHEQVVTFDYVDSLYGMDRIPEYGRQVEASLAPPAYILFNPGWDRTPRLERRLQELGVQYEKKSFPPLEYIVYYHLSRKVHPSEVMEGLVWPYY
jgi:hypothetical protein